jgi:hypothetical protein
MDDQCAVGPDGQLLDASKITWHHDPDDPKPIQPTPEVQTIQGGESGDVFDFCYIRQQLIVSFLSGQRSRPVRAAAGTRLKEAIAAEKLNEDGTSCRRFILPRDAKATAKRKRPITDKLPGDAIDLAINSDPEDVTYAIPVSEGDDDSPDSDGDEIEIGNQEVCTDLITLTVN